MKIESIKSDVVIVGGGLAALRSAIEASVAGAQVVIVVKRRLGRSGSSASTSAGYSATPLEAEGPLDADNPKAHFNDTMRGGSYINDPRLVEILSQEAPVRFHELESLGVRFQREGNDYVLHASGDHRQPRIAVTENLIGTDITMPLRQEAIRLGCQIVEDFAAIQLLKEDERITGLLCLSRSGEKLLVLQTPSVVLATGGAGQLFSVTSNPIDVTGDGYALGLNAGADLRDMEFIQFYPWRAIEPFKQSRVPIQPSTFVHGGRLLNSLGERFMERYDPERCDSTTRAIAARGIFDQIREGLDVQGGVRLDISRVSDGDFVKCNPKVVKYLSVKGIDYREVDFILAPEAHYFMGGLVMGQDGETSVPGLYVAGETAGGIHGANRLDSNALPETQVFGRRAGRSAAEYALLRPVPPPCSTMVKSHEKLVSDRLGSEGQQGSLKEMRKVLQTRMSRSLGIIRNAADLKLGIEESEQLLEQLRNVKLSTPQDVGEWYELKSLCEVGFVCCTAALCRTESRGAHYREDFPEQHDPGWAVPLIIRQKQAGNYGLSRGLLHTK